MKCCKRKSIEYRVKKEKSGVNKMEKAQLIVPFHLNLIFPAIVPNAYTLPVMR